MGEDAGVHHDIRIDDAAATIFCRCGWNGFTRQPDLTILDEVGVQHIAEKGHQAVAFRDGELNMRGYLEGPSLRPGWVPLSGRTWGPAEEEWGEEIDPDWDEDYKP